MKVLITGSSGFVGSHLMRLLQKTADLEPIAFDGDLRNLNEVEKFFSANPGIEQIVHLAGLAAGNNLDELYEANVKTTFNLLQAATAVGVNKVILASSYGVYGPPLDGDSSKETDELRPDSPYGLSKKWAEDVLGYFGLTKGLKFISLRFASIYGPGNTKGVIYNVEKSARENGKVTVNGDGKQTRNFLYVDDACEAIVKALGYTGGSAVFNIANPERLSLNDIVCQLAQTRQFEVEYQPANNPSLDLAVDTAKAEKELGFRPQVQTLKFD